MTKKILLFNQKEYTEAVYETISDNVKRDYGISKGKDLINLVKDTFINYFPFVGHLPVDVQTYLKNNHKKLFGDLDVKTATLSSALITGIIAAQIGLRLDGFDIGFVKEVYEGWTSMPKYFSYFGEYFSFLGFPNGFPKLYTQIVSWYFIGSSACRIAFNLAGKPIGTPILELPIKIIKKLSEKSKNKKEAEERIKESKELSQIIDEFTEKERRKKEKKLAEETWEEFMKKGGMELL